MSKKSTSVKIFKDGDYCSVVGGRHAGKFGTVKDIHITKTGHMTVTVGQSNGVRFKTLGKNIIVKTRDGT